MLLQMVDTGFYLSREEPRRIRGKLSVGLRRQILEERLRDVCDFENKAEESGCYEQLQCGAQYAMCCLRELDVTINI